MTDNLGASLGRRARREGSARRPASTRVTVAVVVASFVVFTVVGVGVAGIKVVVLALGSFMALAAYAFMRTQDDRRSLTLLWLIVGAGFFGLPAVLLGMAKVAVPAEVGMRLLLVAAWGALAFAVARATERYVRRWLPAASRSTWIAGALSIAVGLVGGVAVPIGALDRVSAPRTVEAFIVWVSCEGVRIPVSEVAPTVTVDDRYPTTYQIDTEGRMTYELPVYWGTYSLVLPTPDGQGILRTEHWSQYPVDIYAEVVFTVATFGLARSSLDYVEGGWQLYPPDCA